MFLRAYEWGTHIKNGFARCCLCFVHWLIQLLHALMQLWRLLFIVQMWGKESCITKSRETFIYSLTRLQYALQVAACDTCKSALMCMKVQGCLKC